MCANLWTRPTSLQHGHIVLLKHPFLPRPPYNPPCYVPPHALPSTHNKLFWHVQSLPFVR
ncbi:hypothetical protein LguiB_013033 [Lonicera macranthoides]